MTPMHTCHCPGCAKQGCRFEPATTDTHWYCVEHADATEEALEKENRTVILPRHQGQD